MGRIVGSLVWVVVMIAAATAWAQGPTVSVEPSAAPQTVDPGGEVTLSAEVKLSSGWHVNSNEPLEDFLKPTLLEFDPPEGVSVEEISYPEAQLLTFEFSDEPMSVYEEEFTISARLAIADNAPGGPYEIPAAFRYQACNDKQCWRPETKDLTFHFIVSGEGEGAPADAQPGDEPSAAESAAPEDAAPWKALAEDFQIAGRTEGYLDSQEFIAFLEEPESAGGLFEGRSLLTILVITFLGGLALNLTPCVLPIIPLNIAVIGAGAQGGSRLRGLALGGTYGLGIALAYGALGLVSALGGATFGTLNSMPWFNFAIAIIFVILAIAMFGFFNIDLTNLRGKVGLQAKQGSFAVAFGMGVVAALLAGACVAPVVIAVIVFAAERHAEGAASALLLPFLLGAGMALPWPIMGAGLTLTPKPGKWTDYVKYAFGVLILGLAGYYGWQGYQLMSVDPDQVQASVEDLGEDGWFHELGPALETAKAEGKPVMIDFWATWCKSCLTMNKTTFKEEAVLAELEDFVKVKYQAEQPGEPPYKAVTDYFDVKGLPTYVILTPKS